MQKLYILFALLHIGQSYGMAGEKDKSIIMVFRNNVSSDTLSQIHQQIPIMSEPDRKKLEKLMQTFLSECSHHKTKVIEDYESILRIISTTK